jgi:hypothetical protein
MELQLNTNSDDELVQLMKANMTAEEERIFMISHYLYLKHGKNNKAFVVDFDDVWGNVGFTRRDNAKRILVKHFVENVNYKITTSRVDGQHGESEKPAPQHAGAGSMENNQDSEKPAPQHTGAGFGEKNKISIHGKNLGGAGLNKETIFLTVDCFKGFCLVAATTKAKAIQTYFIKIETIMHEYVHAKELALAHKNEALEHKNEALEHKNEALEHKNEALDHALQDSQTETAMKRHEVLIESNKNKWVVYFCKMQEHGEGSFILKIGETTDIKNRIDALRCDFGANVILLDVFACENSIKFEKALHNSAELLQYRYNQLERKNKKFSTEAYRIPNQKEYEKIVKFATAEMNKYNNIEITKIRIEEKKIDFLNNRLAYVANQNAILATLAPLCKSYDEVMDIIKMFKLQNDSINNMDINIENETIRNNVENEMPDHREEQAVDEDIESEQETDDNIAVTMTANATGPIVQIYHKDDCKRVVQVYNSITEATREFNYNNKTASFTAIKKAFQHKTIYLDHRWHFISNRQEPNLHQPRDIGNTVITQEKNQGQVAMLNIDKTKVIKVFELAKDAAKEILQHPSAMCSAIKHSSPLNGHYWLRWENVDASLQHDFLQSNILPTKKANVRGIKIQQLHPTTNEVIKTFASYTDIQKELKISIKKIKELVETNETYQGKYKFRPL